MQRRVTRRKALQTTAAAGVVGGLAAIGLSRGEDAKALTEWDLASPMYGEITPGWHDGGALDIEGRANSVSVYAYFRIGGVRLHRSHQHNELLRNARVPEPQDRIFQSPHRWSSILRGPGVCSTCRGAGRGRRLPVPMSCVGCTTERRRILQLPMLHGPSYPLLEQWDRGRKSPVPRPHRPRLTDLLDLERVTWRLNGSANTSCSMTTTLR